MNSQKISYMVQKFDHNENMPLRVLTISECQSLLAKICLSIFIVIESALCINLKVVNFDNLYVRTNEKDQILFTDFKPLVMSLFGQNLFTLSCVDIDSILRKVHRELVVVIQKGQKPPNRNQVMQKHQIKNVTDSDLANLCRDNFHDREEDPHSIEKRQKFQQELMSKKKLISISDLIDHVSRIKFSDFGIKMKDQLVQEIYGILSKIFPKANWKLDEPALINPD